MSISKRSIARNSSKYYLDNHERLQSLIEEFKEPETWTIITALDRVLSLAEGSKLSDEFWTACSEPLDFLRQKLGLTNIQIVVLAILVETGETLTWKDLGNFTNCSRLNIMVYSEEIEELVTKRWVTRKMSRDLYNNSEGYELVSGVVTALRHNTIFVPEKIDGLSEQQFIDRLESHLDKNSSDRDTIFSEEEEWMLQLVKANPQLPLCHEVLKFDDIHVQSLLLMAVFDYAQWADSEDEGLTMRVIDRIYPDEISCDSMRQKLRTGRHVLIKHGYIEFKCEHGVVNNERYMLTNKSKSQLLGNYLPSKTRALRYFDSNNRFLKSHAAIQEKTLFFNAAEEQQIKRLTSLLSTDNLPSIQQRLEEQGMRKGFACLFYGGPGTGKTETVYQIARQTGRDLMQIDIAGLRDKYVGESEKNITEVFARYRRLCKESEVMPILFFNEADAIISKRTENVEHSVDKMDNAMQNIILQELEGLDGILIATTNLTTNLDKAFERRFIYKVQFHNPDIEAKAKIWRSMLKDLSMEEARQLATHFDFSGGQIENIARKRTVDYILSGKHASVDEIEDYCRAELLNDRAHKRIGFV